MQREHHIQSLEGNSPASAAFQRSQAILMLEASEKLVASVDKLESTMKGASASSDRLGRRVFWLNVVIAAATLVGAIATAVVAYATLFKN